MELMYLGFAPSWLPVGAVVEGVTLLLLAVSATLNIVSSLRRFPAVAKAESVLSVPPASAVYTEPSAPPNEAEREVVSAASTLVLTRDERIGAIRLMMSRTGTGMGLLHQGLAPAHVLELAHAFRREAYVWIADDDEELRDEWWDCVMGLGRWGEPPQLQLWPM